MSWPFDGGTGGAVRGRKREPEVLSRARAAGLAMLTPAVAEHVMRGRRAEALVRAGRHAAAERLLRDVAGALARRHAHEPCARVLMALGQLLLVRGRAGGASRSFGEACDAARVAGALETAIDASLWQAGAMTDDGRLDDAAACARAAAAHATSPAQGAWAGSCLARVALWRGDVDAALAQLTPREAHADAAVAAWVEATSVRTLLAGQQRFEAGRRAGAARGALVESSTPHALAIIETAHLRVLCEAGDLEAGRQCLECVAAHARLARTPLCLARARLVWLAALRRAGLERDAEREARRLQTLAAAAPPLFREAIRRACGAGAHGSSHTPGGARVAASGRGAAPTLVPELAGCSGVVDELRRTVARAAAAPFAVLIEGESGVGKELVARAIHRLSPRAVRRFCDVNCAALPDDLVESELFGHARGAFTGAAGDRPGLFEEASGGTLFLDEVSELTARAQAKLLRVIQQQEVRRLGETASRPVDVRMVAAANKPMTVEAAEGRFRLDLFYRLDVIRLRVPPLRDRPEDVAVLADVFWRAAAARVGTVAHLSDDVMRALARYAWPGNVRELQNVMAALAVAAPSAGRVPVSLLPSRITERGVPMPTLAVARACCDRDAVRAALARAGGRRAEAARALGLTRQGLLKMMARLDRHDGGRGRQT